MNIIACQFCRKPFSSLGGKICPECITQLDRDVITIRDYLDEHKGSNIDKISEETEIPKNRIMHLIKEERLIIDSPDGSGGGLLKCEGCGASINTGRLCAQCKKNITGAIEQKTAPRAAPKPKADDFRNTRAKFRK